MAKIFLSIIIPVLNESSTVVGSLSKLSLLRSPALEIILVDGGSGDRTIELATPFVDKVFKCDPGRAQQMNLGAANASGELLWFLHADSILPAHVSSIIQSWREAPPLWGFFTVQLSGKEWLLRWVERGMNWRSRATSVATGDQGIFMQRRLLAEQGGYADMPLMEDVALSKKLRQIASPRIEQGPIVTSSRRWESNGIVNTITFMWWLRLQYFFGASPVRLAEKYYPNRNKNKFLATIIQFAKSPTQGNVKTRLSGVLDLKQRQALHRALINCSLSQITKNSAWIPELHLTGGLAEFKSDQSIKLYLQVAGELGERMETALQQALQKDPERAVILIGSDCPFIDEKYLQDAVEKLKKYPVVLGPALDGGYVLVGVRGSVPSMFTGITWGSSDVLVKTTERLDHLNVSYCLLSPLADIDRSEDLLLLDDINLPISLQKFSTMSER